MPQLHTVKLEYTILGWRTKGLPPPSPHGELSRTKEQTWLTSFGRHRRKQCAAMRFSGGVHSRGLIRAVIFERVSTGIGRGGQLGSCLAVPARGKEEEGLSLPLTFRSRHTTGSPDGLNAWASLSLSNLNCIRLSAGTRARARNWRTNRNHSCLLWRWFV